MNQTEYENELKRFLADLANHVDKDGSISLRQIGNNWEIYLNVGNEIETAGYNKFWDEIAAFAYPYKISTHTQPLKRNGNTYGVQFTVNAGSDELKEALYADKILCKPENYGEETQLIAHPAPETQSLQSIKEATPPYYDSTQTLPTAQNTTLTFSDYLQKAENLMTVIVDKQYSIKDRAKALKDIGAVFTIMDDRQIRSTADETTRSEYRRTMSRCNRAKENLDNILKKEADNYLKKCNELAGVISDSKKPFPERIGAKQELLDLQVQNVYLHRIFEDVNQKYGDIHRNASQKYTADFTKVKGLLCHMADRNSPELSHNFESYNLLKDYCGKRPIKDTLGDTFEHEKERCYPGFDKAYAELMQNFIPVRDNMRANYKILKDHNSIPEDKEKAKNVISSLILELKPEGWHDATRARTKNWENERKRMMKL